MHAALYQTTTNPALFSAEGFVGLVFWVTIGLIVAGAFAAVTATRLVRCIAGLAVCFTGVAGAYYFLLAPFVAMMQMLIYVGAVSILIAFAIMMAAPEQSDTPGKNITRFSGPLGLAIGVLVSAALILMALTTDWQVFPRTGGGDIHHLGELLLTTHSLVFELVSIVLLAAIIGALVIARRGRR